MFSLVTLTFDLDIQPSPSEGPNTVFRLNLAQVRSWCSAVPRGISYKSKKSQTAPKHNLPQFTACGNYKIRTENYKAYKYSL